MLDTMRGLTFICLQSQKSRKQKYSKGNVRK